MKKIKINNHTARRMLSIQISRLEGTPLVDEALVALKIGDVGLMWKMAKLMRGFEV